MVMDKKVLFHVFLTLSLVVVIHVCSLKQFKMFSPFIGRPCNLSQKPNVKKKDLRRQQQKERESEKRGERGGTRERGREGREREKERERREIDRKTDRQRQTERLHVNLFFSYT